MKKFAILMAVLAMLGSNDAFAQSNKTGKGAAESTSGGMSNGMAWAVGLGALGVLGTVVGVTAASAAGSPSSFGH